MKLLRRALLPVASVLMACSGRPIPAGSGGSGGMSFGDGPSGAGPSVGVGPTTSGAGVGPTSVGAGTGPGSSAGSTGTSSGSSGGSVPEFGDPSTRKLTVIASSAEGLGTPRDLEFAPDHPDELWVVNTDFNGVVILTNPGTAQQTADKRADHYALHFMDKVSSLAFGVKNRFASCQESHDEWNGDFQTPDEFMGPTLWLADLDVFAVTGQNPNNPNDGEGSHIDMLHESPLCMGIAHEGDNIYWAFDGENSQLVRYDFQQDHGPGGGDHSDGRIYRYVDANVTRVPNVPGHLVYDKQANLLYAADTGGHRITRLDAISGSDAGDAFSPPNLDGILIYKNIQGANYTELVKGLNQPSGLELLNGRLFVTDHGTGEIIAYDLNGTELGRIQTGAQGIMGLTKGPDGKLWYVDGAANTVVRVDP